MAKLESQLSKKYTIMKYETATGKQKSISMNEDQLQEWKNCYLSQRPYLFEVEGIVKGLNPSHIIDFEYLAPCGEFDHLEELSKQFAKVIPMSKPQPEPSPVSIKEVAEEETAISREPREAAVAFTPPPKITFKVECKCGASYPARLYRETRRCNCKYCNEFVFVDYSEGLQPTKFGQGYLLTNKKYVQRDQEVPKELYNLQEV